MLASVLAVGSLVLGPAAGAAAACQGPSDPCVVVVVVGQGGFTKVVTTAQLDAIHDESNPDVDSRFQSGGTVEANTPRIRQATSVPAILQYVGVAPASAKNVRISGGASNSRVSILDGDELLEPTDTGFPFAHGVMPAVWGDPDAPNQAWSLSYFRPLRTDIADDVNGADVRSTDPGGPMTIEVHTSGEILRPVIAPSSMSTTTGTPLTFDVSLDQGPPPGVTLTYAWTFGDGSTSAVTSPRHAWADDRTGYAVNLTVSSADGDFYGVAPTVVIQVGKAPPATGATAPGTGTGGATSPVTGPSHAHGHVSGGTSTGGAVGSGATGSGDQTSAGAASGTVKKKVKKHLQPQVEGLTTVNGTSLDHTQQDVMTTTGQASVAAAPSRAAPAIIRQYGWLWLLIVPGLLLVGAIGQSRWLSNRLRPAPWRVM